MRDALIARAEFVEWPALIATKRPGKCHDIGDIRLGVNGRGHRPYDWEFARRGNAPDEVASVRLCVIMPPAFGQATSQQ